MFGKTGTSFFGNAEVGLYLNEGSNWRDIEVELDLMETGSGVVHPGPFLRVQEPNPQHTTAWWFEYWTDHKDSAMRPFNNNKDGGPRYKCQLPETFVTNKWFHFRYRVLGNQIMQWANKKPIQNATVDSEWMIPRGSIGLGCHTIKSGSYDGCRTFYDNIKVRFLVESNPTVSTGDSCQLAHEIKMELPLGTRNTQPTPASKSATPNPQPKVACTG
ncbi:hypothetical protein OS493_016885 [Desmophyllum pertusum]|uniref:Uncharacterized protein n=1 Tax=Desmophyllum pertusum TaxID=174260 RepID=A0A9W9YPZ0_9CNID|nr:hypothetical protein OS493_016885 [Desmophyllum pertusum]